MDDKFTKETEKYFENYNRHYKKMLKWFYDHEKLLSQLNDFDHIGNAAKANNSSNCDSNLETDSTSEKSGNVKHRNRSQAYLLRKKAKKKKKRKQNQLDRRKNNSIRHSFTFDEDDNDEEDEYEMELNEEMRKFFEISAKHREERERNRALKQNKTELKFEFESTNEKEFDTDADKETQNQSDDLNHIEKPGEARLKEMKELYGEGAAKIHAMETAMQLTFNHNFDQNVPKLWPAVPLNIKFN